MRLMGCLLLAVLMLWPATTFASSQQARAGATADCRRMTRQIKRYEDVVMVRAKARGDKLWENSMQAQVSRLKNRRADRCPEYRKQRSALRRVADDAAKMRKLMSMAAKGAAKYFSGGWL